jgi:hypothetical protein
MVPVPCASMEGADGRRGPEQGEGREPPAHLESSLARVRQGPIADLGSEVEDDDEVLLG